MDCGGRGGAATLLSGATSTAKSHRREAANPFELDNGAIRVHEDREPDRGSGGDACETITLTARASGVGTPCPRRAGAMRHALIHRISPTRYAPTGACRPLTSAGSSRSASGFTVSAS